MRRKSILRDGPNPIDVHVAQRMRDRMAIVGMTHQRLGEHVGCTFQQIGKRVSGTNRMSEASLFETAKALGVPASYFFEGIDQPSSPGPSIFELKAVREMAQAFVELDAVTAQMFTNLIRRLADGNAKKVA